MYDLSRKYKIIKISFTFIDHTFYIMLHIKSTLRITSLLASTFISTALVAQTKTYKGDLDVMGQKLPLVFHIQKENNSVHTKMDSPKQGALGIPMDETIEKADSVFIKANAMGMQYKGKYTDDGIHGTFEQGGMSFPLYLTLDKDAQASIINRPQTPQPPFEYTAETVSFTQKSSKYTIGGTLTIPKNQPKAVVILVSGSGQQDRDETIMEHKPFAVIADYLTQHDIAVLRYDDRGVGATGGDPTKGTSLDNAEDALAAVAFIKKDARLQQLPLGILGHSEGGLIAFLAAQKTTDINYIVSTAGPSVGGDTILTSQKRKMMELMSTDASTINFNDQLDKELYALIKQYDNINNPKATKALKTILQKHYKKANATIKSQLGSYEDFENAIISSIGNEWIYYFIKTSPYPYIAQYKGNVLVLQGMKDVQVLPEVNLPNFEKALKHNQKNQIITYPEGNHLLQPAQTGMPTEYGMIEQTIIPKVLEDIKTFILSQ